MQGWQGALLWFLKGESCSYPPLRDRQALLCSPGNQLLDTSGLEEQTSRRETGQAEQRNLG